MPTNIHKLTENINIAELMAAISRAAGTVNGTGIDLSGLRGDVVFKISVGDKGAAGTVDAKLQESDDNAAWNDLAGGSLAQITLTGYYELRRSIRAFTKRYARLVVTVAVNAVVYQATVISQKNDLP